VTRSAVARLFVAVDLPAEVRTRLTGWARSCVVSIRAASHTAVSGAGTPSGPPASGGRADARRGDSRHPRTGGSLRLLDADALHLTLRFLGSLPVGEIEAIGEAVAAACAEAPLVGELTLGAPLWLPPRRPRALAVELHDDPLRALQTLHDVVAETLATVCDLDLEPPAAHAGGEGAERGARGRRFRPHITVARMRAGDAPPERGLPATPALSFIPRSVTLYRSWLTPAGAVYEGLSTTALAVC
jgi:2'-5' RNA ligase